MTLRWSLLLMLAMVVSCGGRRGNSSHPESATSASAAEQSETKVPPPAGSTRDTDLVRKFVQEFYDWYVPIANNGQPVRASDVALKSRPSAFDSLLAGQLKEDSDAQAKARGEIVGLDFDPFLASQDPCERYEVVNVRTKAQSYLVDVRGVGGCEKHEDADLVAEVVSKNGAWLFANFHYPGPPAGDLLAILKTLRDGRH